MSLPSSRAHPAGWLGLVLLPLASLVGCGGNSSDEWSATLDEGGADGAQDASAAGQDAPVRPGVDASPGADAIPGNDSATSGDTGSVVATGDGALDTSGPFAPAMHGAFPLIQNNGGGVISNPKLLGVFFSDYDNTTGAVAAMNGMPTATMPNGENYWSAAVSEYGVGPLTVLPPVMLAQSAPTDPGMDPQSFVSNLVDTNAAFANVDSSTIVALFYPSTLALSGSCMQDLIGGWGGYHAAAHSSKVDFPFAVIGECAHFRTLVTALDMVTVAVSHETIEAATDPGSGFIGLDTTTPAGFAWDALLAGNEENGDMCAISAGYGRPGGSYPYLLQRGWSNQAAMAGNLDPCQPDMLPNEPFVGAYPVMPDTVSAGGGGGGGATSGAGALVAVGSSKTVEVDCYSFQPTAPFTVGAKQKPAVSPPELTFAWDRTTCSNGDKLHLTVTVQSQGQGGVEPFMVYAQLPDVPDAQMAIWAGVVGQQ
jgi:hypothetical protein